MSIEKITSTKNNVKIELKNGVSVHLSLNEGYIHLSFSGVEIPIKVGYSEKNAVNSSNVINVFYEEANE